MREFNPIRDEKQLSVIKFDGEPSQTGGRWDA